MTFRRDHRMFWATGAALLCLLGILTVRVSARQAAPAPAAAAQAPGVLTTDQLFKNIQVLKGIPVDTFFDVMGMFASSMGEDCTFCHVKQAFLDRNEFATATPRIQRARQMIVMMQTINKNYFGATPRVTCYTCHRANTSPVNAPRLSVQYGEPDDDPNVIAFPTDTNAPPANQTFDKYLEALGGTAAIAKLTSFTAKGTYEGFDTGHKEVPVDIYAKAPNQRTWVIHMQEGDSYRVFDGKQGWWAGNDGPTPLEVLTTGNLDRYRIEAGLAFPTGIKTLFGMWRMGRTAIDDSPVRIVQGTNPGLLPVNFYFDNKTNLLVRWVRWNDTPVGPVPTEINYGDYRPVAGVKMPFTWTVSQTYMQMTIKLSAIQPNVTIDPKIFDKPAPAVPTK
jgi:photosynthetic reaction center cytochrome c subunit